MYKIYKDDSLELHLEDTKEGLYFIHCNSFKWSLSEYKHYLDVFSELMLQLADKGITKVYAAINNKKLEKFASMFGFVEDNWSVKDTRGDEREVWVWSMQQQH